MTTSASPAPSGRTTGAMTPVEVSLWTHARMSADGSATGAGASPGSAATTIGAARNGARGRRGRELAAELAEDEVQRALADEAERGGVPERRRAAVAERDLIAVGRAEQLAEAGADAADELLDGLLAMRRPHDRGVVAGEVRELLRADLRGADTETAVGRSERLGDLELGARRHGMGPRFGCVE